jgi:hypothetical protein
LPSNGQNLNLPNSYYGFFDFKKATTGSQAQASSKATLKPPNKGPTLSSCAGWGGVSYIECGSTGTLSTIFGLSPKVMG